MIKLKNTTRAHIFFTTKHVDSALQSSPSHSTLIHVLFIEIVRDALAKKVKSFYCYNS